jgi:hypothetical protein
VWTIYPRKLTRKAALRAYTATRRRGVQADTLAEAVRNFAEVMRRERRPHDKTLKGSTFFGPD